MNSKNLILTVVLLIAIFSSLWLVRDSFITRITTNKNLADTPDGFMTNAHYVRFDPNGEIASTLVSPKLVHYQNDDTTLFNQPKLIIINNTNHNQWTITADTGISKFGSEQVDLKNNVKIVRVIPQKSGLPNVMTITTPAMTAYPHKQFAETNEPVTIVQPGSIINSVGMTANLNTGDITLLSKAQGVYTPGNGTTTPTPGAVKK